MDIDTCFPAPEPDYALKLVSHLCFSVDGSGGLSLGGYEQIMEMPLAHAKWFADDLNTKREEIMSHNRTKG